MPVIVGPGDPGSTVDLTAIWLNAARDLSDSRSFNQAGETLSHNTTAQVETRQLIGRRRMVSTGSGGPAESGAMRFEQCDADQVAWLRAHVGALLCYRDHVGSKWFGFYKETPREVQTAYRDRTDVSLSMESITYSEAV